MGIGAWNFITTFIAVGFVERAGRRPLLLIGLLIVTVSDMALCISSLAIPGQAGSYISIISVFIFIASFEAGIGCVFWIVVTEMFPAEVQIYHSLLNLPKYRNYIQFIPVVKTFF